MENCPAFFALGLALLVPIIIFAVSVMVLEIVALWFMFEKAQEPGWAAIIPIYNYLIAIKIAGKPWWFLLLMIIPVVNIDYLYHDPARNLKEFREGCRVYCRPVFPEVHLFADPWIWQSSVYRR